jgi:hypothetical protein
MSIPRPDLIQLMQQPSQLLLIQLFTQVVQCHFIRQAIYSIGHSKYPLLP